MAVIYRVEKMPSLDALTDADYNTSCAGNRSDKEYDQLWIHFKNEERGKAVELARKEIVDANDVVSALDTGKMGGYVTDFRLN